MSNTDSELLAQIIEKEKFVLSAMLIREGECVPTVAAILSGDEFYRPKHRITYRTILKIYDAGKPVHILNLLEEFQKDHLLNDIGIEFAYSLTEYANTNAFVESYAHDIKEQDMLRRLVLEGEKIAYVARKGTLPAADIIHTATNNFNAIAAVDDEQFKLSEVNDCLHNHFLPELEKLSNLSRLSTGFQNFDDAQILLPGLYLIGAEPAIGKTDFVWQLLEQMSRNGCKCVYASYEMDRMTMLRRLIARQIFKKNPFTVLTPSNLHENLKYPEHKAAITKALELLDAEKLDLHILELYGQNVDGLIRRLKPLYSNDKPLVIAIDYLQNIKNDKDAAKADVDESLRALKIFQRDTGAVIFVVSSFNRAGYRLPVSYASFKESGSCEYFADAMFGLQLYAVNQITGRETGIEISNLISDAFKSQPRHIQMRCIKNRAGSTYDLYFKYHSAHSVFEPCNEPDFLSDEIPANVADDKSNGVNTPNGKKREHKIVKE